MTTQDSAANPFEYWREMFQKSTEAWAQAASAGPGAAFWPPFFGTAPSGAAPGFGFPGAGQMPGFGPGLGGAPGGNPFAQFVPPFSGNDFQQMWQQFYNTWAEQAQKAMSSGAQGPEVLLNAQKQWSDQLEAMAKTFAEVMGTEAFASMLGRYMEQNLVWQNRMANATEPQQDSMLKAMNMPSRGQIDRMFERVIGLEDRIDDLEDENRKLRAQVEAALKAQAPRGRSRAANSPAQDEASGSASQE